MSLESKHGVTYHDPTFDSQLEAALAVVAGQKGDGVVDLYRYTAATFQHSRAASDGQTLEEHHARVDAMAAALRARGLTVNVAIVGEA